MGPGKTVWCMEPRLKNLVPLSLERETLVLFFVLKLFCINFRYTEDIFRPGMVQTIIDLGKEKMKFMYRYFIFKKIGTYILNNSNIQLLLILILIFTIKMACFQWINLEPFTFSPGFWRKFRHIDQLIIAKKLHVFFDQFNKSGQCVFYCDLFLFREKTFSRINQDCPFCLVNPTMITWCYSGFASTRDIWPSLLPARPHCNHAIPADPGVREGPIQIENQSCYLKNELKCFLHMYVLWNSIFLCFAS